jgi:hypothetical protein
MKSGNSPLRNRLQHHEEHGQRFQQPWKCPSGDCLLAEASAKNGQSDAAAAYSAIARAITGTAWSGPRFFALARGNGASARCNKNGSARESRNGALPAPGVNTAALQTAPHALGGRAGRMQRNGTGDQSQLEITFPVGAHNQLLWFYARRDFAALQRLHSLRKLT